MNRSKNFLLEVDNDNVFTDYPCADNYRGRNPFSETEPDSIQKFVKSIERNLMFFNSIQSFGERVLLPWNCNEAINSGNNNNNNNNNNSNNNSNKKNKKKQSR